MSKDHWNEHARQWSYVGPPLRPSAEDVQLIERMLLRENSGTLSPEGVLLGVTPELAGMNWPANTTLTAIDRNQAMIDGVWPDSGLPANASAICGDWLNTPFEDRSKDIIVGDGCFTLLSFSEHYHPFLSEIKRILSDQGVFIIRHFCRPASAEKPQDVFDNLEQGKIGNFHVLKWRLAMALHGTLEEGVSVNDIWECWHQQGYSPEQLSAELGWPVESIRTINNYKNSEAVYTFPTVSEIASITAEYFHELDRVYLDYELGDRCPTFLLTNNV